jgi:hypothetical protein
MNTSKTNRRGRPLKGLKPMNPATRVRLYRLRRRQETSRRIEVMLDAKDLRRIHEIGAYTEANSYPEALRAAVVLAVSAIPAAKRRSVDPLDFVDRILKAKKGHS